MEYLHKNSAFWFHIQSKNSLLFHGKNRIKYCIKSNVNNNASIGVVFIGTIMGYASPAGAILTSNSTDSGLYLTNMQNSWFTSVSNVGAMIGCPFAGFSINILGRRGTIIYAVIPALIGWIFIVFAQNFEMLVIGRLITGTSCSLISLAVPTYIAEFSSPPYSRNFLPNNASSIGNSSLPTFWELFAQQFPLDCCDLRNRALHLFIAYDSQ
ncbi:Sugar transporter ERD6-like 4 [Armadillidium nasatum]|uniref:Sugar transporter ERD6-like 4 n=1 Tax=Armadillidium nasatum TaxID=96803 RepID=A0A5N5T8J8_9CRUS|nr:Sugar transporter ERD6-like 4 [Armadillidium nasatum]